MGETKPKYWGSWKGRVIRSIASDGSQTWNELLEKTGLTDKTLNMVLAELYEDQAIQKKLDGKYIVRSDLYKEYKAFLKGFETSDELDVKKKQQTSGKFSESRKADLTLWIEQWRNLKKLKFSLEQKHFFLEGRYLDDISKELICNAKSEVLVVNPYVDQCDLSDALRDVRKSGKSVVLLTRPPEGRYQPPREKQDYHDTLRKDGVTLVYNKRVHAKLIIVDRALAIVSSMNFYSGSSGGYSWEAGLVSIDDVVVESAVDSILTLLEKPESRRSELTNDKQISDR